MIINYRRWGEDMEPEKFIERWRSVRTDDEWVQLYNDIEAYAATNPSKDDLKKYLPFGVCENVFMMWDGIMRERGIIKD